MKVSYGMSTTLRLTLLTALLLIATAAETLAQGSNVSPQPTPPSASSGAPQTPAPRSALPPQLNDPRFLQQTLEALEFQTKRAELAEKAKAEAEQQRDEWKRLYEAERGAGDLAGEAREDRKAATEGYRTALGAFQLLHEEDKGRIAGLEQEVKALRKSRVEWGLKGGALGAGICYAQTLPNLFRR